MSYSATTRDRYRLAVAAVSGLATIGALTATGVVAGAAARDYRAEEAQRVATERAERLAWKRAKQERAALIKAHQRYVAQLTANAANPLVVERERPVVTRVTTRYVSSGGSGQVGSGGTVSSGGTPSGGSSGGTSSGGTSSGGSSGGGGTTAPPPPPPRPPPPAASSGS